ncbi:MAG: FecR domain-containing protein [Flavobacteriales bacterium]|nr:FecR domain-containing protein [Flavobacteriales bacterium]
MDQNGIDSDLLARYVAGEADPWQRAQVETWVALGPANAEELDRMQRIWSITADAGSTAFAAEMRAWAIGAEAMARAKEAEERAWATGAAAEARARLMEDRAWDKVQARIAAHEGRGRVIPIHRRTDRLRWLAAAAAVAGIVFAVRWFMQPKEQEFLATTAPTEAVLADNSAVVLSAGTQLTARMGRTREVRLQGEAYFEVQRDTLRPFVVDAGAVQVSVLGTAFVVSAYDSSAIVEVRVRSGLVRVVAAGDTATLTAGQHAIYDRTRHVLERRAAPPAEVWGVRVLQFENAPLSLVVAQLQRIYGVQVAFSDESIGRCRLTTEFDDEPVETVLRIIAETFGLELLKESEQRYMLSGDGC